MGLGRLEGKVAVITGGARGIGKGCALTFAKEKARVAIGDLDKPRADMVICRIRETGGEGIAISLDVTRSSDVKDFVKAVVDHFGKIDILVNAVGIMLPKPFLEMEERLWDEVISVNLKGAFLVSQAVAREMAKRKEGKIVNISSLSGDLASPNSANYTASKGGLNALTRSMAVDLIPHSISVNAIAPTYIVDLEEGTVMGRPLSAKGLREVQRKAEQAPLMRQIGYPEDIARVALFLASDDSGLITGQVINVCAGNTIRLDMTSLGGPKD